MASRASIRAAQSRSAGALAEASTRELVSASSTSLLGEQTCDRGELTVTCLASTSASTPTTVTIVVTPTQSGTFTNTARTQSTGLDTWTTFQVTEDVEDGKKKAGKNPHKCKKIEKRAHVRKCHERR